MCKPFKDTHTHQHKKTLKYMIRFKETNKNPMYGIYEEGPLYNVVTDENVYYSSYMKYTILHIQLLNILLDMI